jgi:hypothetical protein
MTREELVERFKGAERPQDAVARVVRDLEVELRQAADGGMSGMRVIVRPVADLALPWTRTELEPLLREPRRTGNRIGGWDFTSEHLRLREFERGFEFSDDRARWSTTTIQKRGELDFRVGLERLHWQGPPQTIWPFALLEFPASIMRLARTLYKTCQRLPETIVLGMGMFQIKGWTLAPYSPSSVRYRFRREALAAFEVDHFLGKPIAVGWSDLDETPDRCAYRLVRQVYEDFGFEEHQIPREYNRDTGQLTFPA